MHAASATVTANPSHKPQFRKSLPQAEASQPNGLLDQRLYCRNANSKPSGHAYRHFAIGELLTGCVVPQCVAGTFARQMPV